MSYNFKSRQKSLQRRFLFILGLITFLACFTLGLMVIFWDRLIERLSMPSGERIALGAMLLLYSLIRFARFFKKEPDEQ